MSVLEQILTATRKKIERKKQKTPLDFMMREAEKNRTKSQFVDKILARKGAAIIAEIKNSRPNAPCFSTTLSFGERMRRYEKGGASAISIVVEEKFFGGSPQMVSEAKRHSSLPILYKDFILDPYQIYEAKAYGADAILLIAKIINDRNLRYFAELAKKIGLEPVVEVQTETELKQALGTQSRCIAVNARNLHTLEVDREHAIRIGKLIPRDRFFVAFSGVENKKNFTDYVKAGARAVLVGSVLMESDSPDMILEKFINPVKVKICGVQTKSAALTASRYGADFLGFIFVKGKKRTIDPLVANKIIESLPKGAQTVGVFADAPFTDVINVAKKLHLNAIQLHGDEPPSYVKRIGKHLPVWNAFRLSRHLPLQQIESMLKNYEAEYFLIDRLDRASEPVPMETLEDLSSHYPIALAGGLTPDTVGDAVSIAQPSLVDVSSGVERNGEKDSELIKQFIKKAKSI